MELSSVTGLLENIPATFWGVIAGSFFSILGVWLTNREGTKRLQRQFEHERFLKTRDRELDLKKDIYLEAAEAMSLAIETVSRLGNLEFSDELVMESYSKKSPSMAKVQVVGSIELQEAMFTFCGEHNDRILKLSQTRYMLMAEKAQIANLDTQVGQFSKEADRFLEMMKQYNIAGLQEPTKWDVLCQNYTFEHARSVKTCAESRALSSKMGLRHLEFIDECRGNTIAMVPFVIPVLTAMRSELEIPFNKIHYERIVLEMQDNHRKTMACFKRKMAFNFPPDSESK